MEQDLPIDARVTIPGDELWVRASRASGPGGQHVNTTSSRVTLTWAAARTRAVTGPRRAALLERLGPRLTRDGELQVHVEDHRSQHRNRELARERLAELVRHALRPRHQRVPTRPSRAARRRRLDAKRKRGQVKRMRGKVEE